LINCSVDLASLAARHVTGTTMTVDGGLLA